MPGDDTRRARSGPGAEIPGQARALGDPTRYAVFERLREAGEPLGVAQLAKEFALHANAIRLHLAKLRDAGLVVEETAAPRGRGRPPLVYRLSPGAIERWEAAGPHEELALMLLEMVEGRRPARSVGHDAGLRMAARLSGTRGSSRPSDAPVEASGGDPVETVVGVARHLGFEPTEPRPTGTDPLDREIVLRRCPFAVGAQRAPHVVCELHRGLAEGICRPGSGAVVTDLVVRDPHSGGCSLRLRLEPVVRQPDGDPDGAQARP